MLKSKRSELRLYCDLLVQQVHTIKVAVQDPSDKNNIELEKLNDGCSLLTQTCDTFIHTLDETMKLTLGTTSHDRDMNIGVNSTSPVSAFTNVAEDHNNIPKAKNISSKR